jgi:hypothetical protein
MACFEVNALFLALRGRKVDRCTTRTMGAYCTGTEFAWPHLESSPLVPSRIFSSDAALPLICPSALFNCNDFKPVATLREAQKHRCLLLIFQEIDMSEDSELQAKIAELAGGLSAWVKSSSCIALLTYHAL